MNSRKRAKENRKYKKLNICLFLLIILDFILTYIGVVNLKVIYEANPLMVWIFNLPFLQGLFIRVLQSGFITYLLFIIYKNNYHIYKLVIRFGLGVNLFIMGLHLNWIFSI